MRAPALAIAALACGCGPKAKPAPTTTAENHTEQAAPGPVYASMFVAGTTWEFDVEDLDSTFDENDQMHDDEEHLAISCTVAEVKQVGDATVSRITCGDGWPEDKSGEPLTGVWAMNAHGLWMVGQADEIDEEVALEGDPMLANPPVEWAHEETDQDSGETINQTSMSQSGDAWCYDEQWVQGDSSWSKICLSPRGPTEGQFGWAGAEEHSASFTLVE